MRNIKKRIKMATVGIAALASAAMSAAVPHKVEASELTDKLTGHVHAHYEVLSGKFGEATKEAGFDLGYMVLKGDKLFFKEDNYSVIFPFIRGKVKHDEKGAERFWNNYEEVAIGIQARYMDIFAVGAEGGYRDNRFNNKASGEFARAYAEFWHKWFGPDLAKSNTFPLTPVILEYGELNYHGIEDSMLAKLGAQVGLRVLNADNRYVPFTLDAPSFRAKISTDTANLPWNRHVEYAAGAELEAKVGDLPPIYARFEVGRRDSFHRNGPEGDFVRFVIGFWWNF